MPGQRGDVVLCRVPMPSTGLTQFKLRPAVVVSKDVNNQRLDDVVVAPCTSNISRSGEPTHYPIDGAEITTVGIRVPLAVRCEALMTIPTKGQQCQQASISSYGLVLTRQGSTATILPPMTCDVSKGTSTFYNQD